MNPRSILARCRLLSVAVVLGLLSSRVSPIATAADLAKAAKLETKGMAAHEKRCLNDASAFYLQVLKLDPPAEPSSDQAALVSKLAPRLYTVSGEFFPLNDVVAVIHPDKPIIAYHLFWDDDIDFPEDNDPTDHEIVWIEYHPTSRKVTGVATYFHSRILRTDQAAADANAHGSRAWIGVEWGKHGSLPWDAAGVNSGKPEGLLQEDWEILHTKGRRLPDHPLARGWPLKFTGDFNAYRDFSVLVDPLPLLKKKQLIKVSRWPNAVLNQHCLRYNFAPKSEWPWSPPS